MDLMEGKDGDGKEFTDNYIVTAHGTTKLMVVHTNVPEEVEKVLAMYEGWLLEPEDRYKIVGLDLEYTFDRRKAALVQLSMRKHCLLYHFCRAKRDCPKLRQFLGNREINFASVDITHDKPKLEHDILVHVKNHVDIQLEWRFPGQSGKAGMARLAAAIIDCEYGEMKNRFPKELHCRWEWRKLDADAIAYAARDAYVCYEMYNKICQARE